MKLNRNHFFTRSTANNGAVLKLDGPDGQPTEMELTVVGFESDAFGKAIAEKARAEGQVELLFTTDEERDAERVRLNVVLISALVIGWNFDEEFSRDAVIELLTEAPYIRRKVETFAAERQNFLGKR